MEMKQKQGEPERDAPRQDQAFKDNAEAQKAAEAGRDLLKRLSQKTEVKRKKGRWVECCGVRTWVED